MHQQGMCLHCGEALTMHYELFEHIRCSPGHGPAAQRAYTALQAELRAMERRSRQRSAALRMLGTGITVHHAEESQP